MHLMRCLAFILAKHEIAFRASHIKGVVNVGADALSRNDVAKFRLHCLQAVREPTPIPDSC